MIDKKLYKNLFPSSKLCLRFYIILSIHNPWPSLFHPLLIHQSVKENPEIYAKKKKSEKEEKKRKVLNVCN